MRNFVSIFVLGVSIAVPASLRAQDHQAPSGHTPDHMEHSFADAEQYAKSFDDPARDAWQMPDRVIAALGLKAGQSVADIGAGTGYFSVRLAKSSTAPKVFAVDVEASMVDYIQKRATREGLKNIVGITAAAERSNLPEPVDVVLIVDTYHHLPNRVAYFTALKSLMKPGGKLAIVDYKKDAPGEGPPKEFRFMPEEISSELAKAGFVLDAQHNFLPRQNFLVYRAK